MTNNFGIVIHITYHIIDMKLSEWYTEEILEYIHQKCIDIASTIANAFNLDLDTIANFNSEITRNDYIECFVRENIDGIMVRKESSLDKATGIEIHLSEERSAQLERYFLGKKESQFKNKSLSDMVDEAMKQEPIQGCYCIIL